MTRPTGKTRTTPANGTPMTAADILARKRPAALTVPICLDTDLLDTKDTAARLVTDLERRARTTRDDGLAAALAEDLAQARADLGAAEEAVKFASVRFRFRALGNEAFEKLMKEHPPTQAQVAEHLAQLKANNLPPGELQYNAVTFPPALIAAGCVDPVFTLEEATEMWESDDWSTGELTIILNAAYSVNHRVRS